jgi:hypothetical protein
MTTENQNTEQPPRMVRVRCLKNFNLEGLPGMFIHGTEQEITEKQVEFLQKMGLTSQPFIEIIDPDYNKPAPQPAAAAPVTWTQTHGGKGIGSPVEAGLNAPVSTPAPAETRPEPPEEPAPTGPEAPEGTDATEAEPVKETSKKTLNLRKK